MIGFNEIQNFLFPIAGLIIACIVTLRSIPIIKLILTEKQVFDMQDSLRKLHAGPIPSLGGVAIFAAVLIAFSIIAVAMETWSFYPVLAGALSILFFTGLKDDLLVLCPKKKLLMQFTASSLLVIGGELYIESFGGLFGIYGVPIWFSIPFTIFVLTVIVNAYNLIDGIDGLAGVVGLVATIFLGSWFIAAGLIPYAVFSFCIAGALLGFLRFNWRPASILMGDTGAMVTGFIIGFLTISMLQTGMAMNSAPVGQILPVFAMALLSVPLYDTIRVFSLRIARGTSPFTAGTDHVHHVLLSIYRSHKVTAVHLLIANVVVVLFVILFSALPINILYILSVGLCLVVFPTIGMKTRVLLKLNTLLLNTKPTNGMNGRKEKQITVISPRNIQARKWNHDDTLERESSGYSKHLKDIEN